MNYKKPDITPGKVRISEDGQDGKRTVQDGPGPLPMSVQLPEYSWSNKPKPGNTPPESEIKKSPSPFVSCPIARKRKVCKIRNDRQYAMTANIRNSNIYLRRSSGPLVFLSKLDPL